MTIEIDLRKLERGFRNKVEIGFDYILEKETKHKKRIRVRATPKRKEHWRTVLVGTKEDDKKSESKIPANDMLYEALIGTLKDHPELEMKIPATYTERKHYEGSYEKSKATNAEDAALRDSDVTGSRVFSGFRVPIADVDQILRNPDDAKFIRSKMTITAWNVDENDNVLDHRLGQSEAQGFRYFGEEVPAETIKKLKENSFPGIAFGMWTHNQLKGPKFGETKKAWSPFGPKVEPAPVTIKGPADAEILDTFKKLNDSPGVPISNVTDDGSFTLTKHYHKFGKGSWDEMFNFQIDGNDIVRKETGDRISIPARMKSSILHDIASGKNLIIGRLIQPKTDSNFLIHAHNKLRDDYDTNLDKLLIERKDLKPDLEPVTGETESKYLDKMKLHNIKNPWRDGSPTLAEWYGGEKNGTSFIGEAYKAIRDGNFDANNIHHPSVRTAMELSKQSVANHGADHIYRGETNPSKAINIVESIMKDGKAELEDHLMSWTENEQLGKWYAGVHDQVSAAGHRGANNVMLRLPKDKYEKNVAFDYRSAGSMVTPEEEITISGKNLELSKKDVVIQVRTPSHEKGEWITMEQYETAGGNLEELQASIKKRGMMATLNKDIKVI